MKVPEEVQKIEVPAMRLTFTMMMALFAIAIAEEAFGQGEAHIPGSAALLMIVTYIVYLVFILSPRYMERVEKPKKKRIIDEKAHGHTKSMIGVLLLLGFGGIFIAAEMISMGVEHLVETGGWGELQIAFIVGMAASLPEHSIALLAAFKDDDSEHGSAHGIELGLGNVLAGALQNLVLIIGIIGLLAVIITGAGIAMTEFILIQLFFGGILVFHIKSSMTDDRQLTIFEGITIVLAQVFVFLILFGSIL
jgi:Ca2+/Na+ antiporter